MLMLILKIALLCAGIGVLVFINIFIWGCVIAVIRGMKNGNHKNIHKH